MKIKSKLSLGFVVLLIFIIILMGTLLSHLEQVRENTAEIVEDRYQKIKMVNALEENMKTMENILQEMMLKDQFDRTLIVPLEDSYLEMSLVLNEMEKSSDQSRVHELIEEFRHQIIAYDRMEKNVIALLEQGNQSQAVGLWIESGRPLQDEMADIVKRMKGIHENRIDQAYRSFGKQIDVSRMIILFATLVTILLSIGVIVWVVGSITRSLKYLTSGITNIAFFAQKDQLPRIALYTKDEMVDIATAVNKMAEEIEEHTHKEDQIRKNMEKQSWLENHIAELATLCQGIQELKDLAFLFVSHLAPVVGASYGVIYLKTVETEDRFYKVGSYADCTAEVGEGSIIPGQGLAGECALENKRMIIRQVPEEYIKITSGLGAAKPLMLVLLPVTYEDQVIGVVELASFEPFSELHLSLFDQVLPHIGVIVNSVLNQMKVQHLLEESRTLAEELQAQSEELQTQQEELRSINEELHEQNRATEEKTKELEKTRSLLEDKNVQLTLISKYKSEFLANMSHELRTPLNSLLILSQMLTENQEGNLTGDQLKYARTINQAGKELLGLINSILDLSKIEAGKMAVHAANLALEDLAVYMGNQFTLQAEEKGILFDVRLDPHLPSHIASDEQKLKQILNNMISNGIKFTESGSVVLEIRKAEKKETEKIEELKGFKEVIAFTIRDTGIGIPKEKMDIIFQSFEQGDEAISRKYGGTGLGLSISKGLAQFLGGVIKAVSKEGKGSIFTLFLPEKSDFFLKGDKADTDQGYPPVPGEFTGDAYTQKDSPCLEPDEAEKELLTGKKILIVDDDMRNIFALTAALESRGVTVIFAETGKQALDMLKDHLDVDLILMDIMMPEMDGYQTIQHIRQSPEFSKLPIIAATAKAMKGDRKKCIDAGASDYICKPVEMDQLYSLMRVWLYQK